MGVLKENNQWVSFVYNKLVQWSPPERSILRFVFWYPVWRAASVLFSKCTVMTRIHGSAVCVNFGYTYPVFARRFKTLNNPLLELVYQCFLAKIGPINFVDVGAAIGDTILLVTSNCPGMVARYFCVDGDPQFFELLKQNLSGVGHGSFYFSHLSDHNGMEKELIRTHSGTASAQGKKRVGSATLDSVLLNTALPAVDLMKIDVDGFDGKVLAGAAAILERDRPAVIFEWEPTLYEKTGNDWLRPFELLAAAGYHRFLWFNNFGKFSHVMVGNQENFIRERAKSCHGQGVSRIYYDVIAVHDLSRVDLLGLEELLFAKAKTSPF